MIIKWMERSSKKLTMISKYLRRKQKLGLKSRSINQDKIKTRRCKTQRKKNRPIIHIYMTALARKAKRSNQRSTKAKVFTTLTWALFKLLSELMAGTQ
jgi:hypothetical protein